MLMHIGVADPARRIGSDMYLRGMAMGTSWRFGEGDYRAIECALLRSDFGRWFLGQYLARNRSAETERLLAALARLEANLAEAVQSDPLCRVREIAVEIDTALSRTLSRASAGESETAEGSDAPVEAILEAVEDINGFLEALETRRVHRRLPEKIRGRLSRIEAACARVDAGARPSPEVVALMHDLRGRLAGVLAELGAEVGPEPGSGQSAPHLSAQLLDELADAFFGAHQACATT